MEAQHQQLEVESKTNAELEDTPAHREALQGWIARRTAEEKAVPRGADLRRRELREKAQLELKNPWTRGAAQLTAAAERGASRRRRKAGRRLRRLAGTCSARRSAGARRERFAKETVARLKLESEHNAKVSRLAVEIDV